MKREESVVIDKSYVPKVGDILWNDDHPLITIQSVYALDKTSLRVNKNYNLKLLKHEALMKITARKEEIWNQHKNDLKFFPEISRKQVTINRDKNVKYFSYLFYNNYNQYKRLYQSKYSSPPTRKVKVVTGQKTMVRVTHGLCKSFYIHNGKQMIKSCFYWGGIKSTAVSTLITQNFKYLGNIYQDLLEENSF